MSDQKKTEEKVVTLEIEGKKVVCEQLGNGSFGAVFLPMDSPPEVKVSTILEAIQKKREEKQRLKEGKEGKTSQTLPITETQEIIAAHMPQRHVYKVIFRPEDARLIANEIKSASNLYRGIERIDVCLDKQKYPAIKLEYAGRTTLMKLREQSLLSIFSLVDRTRFMLQLVSQVCEHHRQRIIHCDIKESNIIIDREACLIDFGCSYQISKRAGQPGVNPNQLYSVKQRGNYQYSAVEMVERPPRAGMKTDTAMLAGPLLSLLLQSSLIQSKQERFKQIPSKSSGQGINVESEMEIARVPFDSDQVSLGIQLDNGLDLDDIVRKYIGKMQGPYQSRPTDESLLKFFSILHQLALCNEKLLKPRDNQGNQENQPLNQQLGAEKDRLAMELNKLLMDNWKSTAAKYLFYWGIFSGTAVTIGTGMKCKGDMEKAQEVLTQTFRDIPIYAWIAGGVGLVAIALCIYAYRFDRLVIAEPIIPKSKNNSSVVPEEQRGMIYSPI